MSTGEKLWLIWNDLFPSPNLVCHLYNSLISRTVKPQYDNFWATNEFDVISTTNLMYDPKIKNNYNISIILNGGDDR